MSTFTVAIEDGSAAQPKSESSHVEPKTISKNEPMPQDTPTVAVSTDADNTMGKTSGTNATGAKSGRELLSQSTEPTSTPQDYTTCDLLNCR